MITFILKSTKSNEMSVELDTSVTRHYRLYVMEITSRSDAAIKKLIIKPPYYW